MSQVLNLHLLCKKLLVFVALIITSYSFAQDNSLRKVYEWTTFFENEFVRIDYKYGDCHIPEQGLHQERVYLQFTNKTSGALALSWQLQLKYGERCYNCNGINSELQFDLKLNPNETVAGGCELKADNKLIIFSKHLDFESATPPLSSFLLKELEYKKL